MEHHIDTQDTSSHHRHLGKWILGIVVVLFIATSVYFFLRYQHAKTELTQLKDPAFQASQVQKENEQLVRDVAGLIELPMDQQPVIGTVQDVATLAEDQKFFSRAQNGDKVLIYEDKAIIYRPSVHKLINVGPVYLNATSTTDITQ
ncbi:MAG: hypothetical protein CO030_05475 [Candidatus Magasanikbacteria bacterium CG_4_9_14_0_2_um_filter_42_11]|uniref:Uncharacterized protein n=1 Tax=Candidatus Magasanikbacteria bacterium CG_4_9_14_0_2_um_filter_42_11 TaxID=1974643 RepID=A0A2M8F897_9BACT|nr:MAG: hypothetical protein COU34_05015 [Candidatus Magasanikbacteria bacterium CG10_big_fil_rev_8_21_14_0_10_43_9]PIY92842.1 MAG: hypothetical protein COY70_01125 [Candidatus Magasanikbacteria bacterium CG_4_10_14_0_8_um_filter_42_12]PJC51945.1 MAG: hypothetical protein CO030_05475 [Candidatus Magasanikbacteria bacterium CG_4_9_14_0_2_um_filter_42_11]